MSYRHGLPLLSGFVDKRHCPKASRLWQEGQIARRDFRRFAFHYCNFIGACKALTCTKDRSNSNIENRPNLSQELWIPPPTYPRCKSTLPSEVCTFPIHPSGIDIGRYLSFLHSARHSGQPERPPPVHYHLILRVQRGCWGRLVARTTHTAGHVRRLARGEYWPCTGGPEQSVLQSMD